MAPFDITSLTGSIYYALVFGLIGVAFGAVLEMSGFGDTRKLAAQFYLRDMTVLKVMLTAIVVAAVLLALSSAFGLLDMNRVWVNPTYLWPGILGGLIMGVGFIVGGFCPGTSLVAAATLKIDGMLFVLGGLIGVWGFGESVGSFEPFYLSSYFGRFTLPQWLGLPVGATVLLVVLMALGMFWAAGKLERRFGGEAPSASRPVRWRLVGAGALVAGALVLIVRGQPSPDERWAWAPAALHESAAKREMLVDPAEVVSLKENTAVEVHVLDLRDEHDFNLFHIGESRRVTAAELERPGELQKLLDQPVSSVTFLVGNGEEAAVETWKALKAQGVPNLYVIEGGINHWLEAYPLPGCVAAREQSTQGDRLAYRFAYAVGSGVPSARPELPTSNEFRFPCTPPAAAAPEGEHAVAGHFVWPERTFTKRVVLKMRTVVKGGCG